MALPDDERLSVKDFAKFLDDKKVQSACRRCGSAEWQTGQGDEIKGFVPVGTDEQGDFRLSESSIPVQYLICTNCGNMEFFATKIVRMWKASRRSAESEGGESDG